MDPTLPHSVRLGDPLRREFLDDLRRRAELPRPLAAEWALADADLIVAVTDDENELVIAAGTLGGPRRWVLRQALDDFDEGDLVEVFARDLLARGHSAESAHQAASQLATRLVRAVGATLVTLARLRPESGSVLRNLAAPLAVTTTPPTTDDHGPDHESDDEGPAEVDEPTTVERPGERPVPRPAPRAVPRPVRPPRRAARTAGTALAGLALTAAVAAVAVVAMNSPLPPDDAASASDDAVADAEAAPAPGVVADYAITLRNADDSPVRLEPCHTYDYEVRPGALESDVAVAEVGAGFAALEEATGAAFRFAGLTHERFPYPLEVDQPTQGPILVSFEHPDDSAALTEGGDAHLVTPSRPLGGLALAGPAPVRPGFSVLAGGAVVVNESLDPAQRARVLLHELGHIAGLGHASDTGQIMATPVPETGPVAYREGDRTGLAELRVDGCLLTDAERVEVLG